MKRKLCSSKILLEKNRSSQRMATEVCFKVNEQNKGLQLGGHHLFSAAEVPHGKHKAENQKEKKKKIQLWVPLPTLQGLRWQCPELPEGCQCLGMMRFLSMSKELPSGCTDSTPLPSWCTCRYPKSSMPTIQAMGPCSLCSCTCFPLGWREFCQLLGTEQLKLIPQHFSFCVFPILYCISANSI